MAIVPSGASPGEREALESRDGDESRYRGGVLNAVQNVNELIAPKVEGIDAIDQALIDNSDDGARRHGKQERLGGKRDPRRLYGGCPGPQPNLKTCPFTATLGGDRAREPPVPMMNVINGGGPRPKPAWTCRSS